MIYGTVAVTQVSLLQRGVREYACVSVCVCVCVCVRRHTDRARRSLPHTFFCSVCVCVCATTHRSCRAFSSTPAFVLCASGFNDWPCPAVQCLALMLLSPVWSGHRCPPHSHTHTHTHTHTHNHTHTHMHNHTHIHNHTHT